jgi:hypothetical protein
MGERSYSSWTKSIGFEAYSRGGIGEGGISFDMIVQERSRPCNVQLQAEAACSRARGGGNRPNIAEPQERKGNKHGETREGYSSERCKNVGRHEGKGWQ